ncbi:uncharacterized protein LY89DRAFT_751796 [Mollisia scopiformis]|uniref:Uncharacterized protein n=1 Tax=Mollisia scopiformis TaxID=149040 RepID=A0A194X5L7_MOLSC|nr:uncharacterized protein LY89DRAFT_751796 [Mollisia scopiformis]KUJ15102.1 hypothetical protein LY89DRAFT_751796 [Mollisia scopiformis]
MKGFEGNKIDKVISRTEEILEGNNAEHVDTPNQKKQSKKSQRIFDTIRKGKALFGFGGKSKASNTAEDEHQGLQQEVGIVEQPGNGGGLMGGTIARKPVADGTYQLDGPLNSHPVTSQDLEAAERGRLRVENGAGGAEAATIPRIENRDDTVGEHVTTVEEFTEREG